MTIPIATYPPMPENVVWAQYYDEKLVPQGLIQYATITATLNYNSVGSWSILLPYTQAMWNMMMSGDFIVLVNWRGLFEFGGKCETPTFSDSIPGASGVSVGTGGTLSGPFITLSGADFLSIIANRIAYPDPTKAWTAQLPNSAYSMIGTLEPLIKQLVSDNVGPTALASRRHPLLDIAPTRGDGPSTIAYTVKSGSGVNLNLLDVIRAMISQAYPNSAPGQGMGVRVTRNGSRLLFDTYTPVNKTNVSFSEDLGNLTSIFFSLTDPTCTDALAQSGTLLNAQGNPTGVTPFYQATAAGTTGWNKTEQFVDDTSETDLNNLKTVAANTLVSGGMGPTLTTTTTDTPYTIYGRDYAIGDIVSVEVQPGNVYTDIVTSVTLTADPSQVPILNVVPVIGNSTDPAATNPTINHQIIAKIKNLEKRLNAKGL